MSRRTVLCVLLAALTLAAYGRIVENGFISYDDRQYLIDNPRVSGGLSPAGALWAFTSFHQANWHPLTWLSHQLDAQLFGLRAAGHHATSLLLHTAGGVALLLALEALTGALWPSFAVAGLFALHPLHVESVAWVAERKDVLSGLLWMLVLGAHVRFARRPTPGRRAAVVALFALGLLAKPMLVTLPFVLLLLDWWPLGRFAIRVRGAQVPGSARGGSARAAVVEKIPLFTLAAASSLVTLLAQRHGGALFPLEALPPATRLGNAALSLVRYLGKTLWPADLSIFYPHPGDSISLPLAAAAGAAALGATALTAACARRHPWLLIGWLWYLGTLVPVIGLVQAGNQALADRYTYLPLVGLFLAAVREAGAWLRQWRPARGAAVAAVVAVLLACGSTTAVQAGHWRDTISIFDHAVRVTPGVNWVAEANLGYEYQRRGEHEVALAHFRKADRRWKDVPDLLDGIGVSLAALGRDAEAEQAYRRALREDPGYVEALFGLGFVQYRQGRRRDAVASYRRALELRPDYYEARVNLASALGLEGDVDGAAAQFEKAVAQRPDEPQGRFAFGALLAKRGQRERAVEQFRAAIALAPDLPEPHHGLGNLLYQQGRYAEAAAEYEQALRHAPEDAGIRANLAQARAAQQGWERAAGTRALEPGR